MRKDGFEQFYDDSCRGGYFNKFNYIKDSVQSAGNPCFTTFLTLQILARNYQQLETIFHAHEDTDIIKISWQIIFELSNFGCAYYKVLYFRAHFEKVTVNASKFK